jgi:hypothetical protein
MVCYRLIDRLFQFPASSLDVTSFQTSEHIYKSPSVRVAGVSIQSANILDAEASSLAAQHLHIRFSAS